MVEETMAAETQTQTQTETKSSSAFPPPPLVTDVPTHEGEDFFLFL